MNNREAIAKAFLEFNNKHVEILFAEDYFKAGYDAALASQAQQEPRTPNQDHVICPACAHDFRAIPKNVQSLLTSAGFQPPFLSHVQQPASEGGR